MLFLAMDTAADSIVTWAVEDNGRVLGTVSQTPRRRFRVTDAGPYCRVPRGDYATRQGAARALLITRRACRAEQIDASGLMQIERDVLDFEGLDSTEPTEAAREKQAALLGISPTLYGQILRRLRHDTRAYARSPQTVKRLREQHEAALTRTARFRRSAAPALAQAS